MVVWIFGYASLVWKAGFEYDERVVGFIKGYRRAFHLACFEHRGTLELPARVATLEQDEDAICWGAAYCIKGAEAAEQALAYLHVRECEYNEINTLEFYTEDSPRKAVIPEVRVFMATTDSKYYLGVAPQEEIAMRIAVATGPSGPNRDYLFRLVEALREIGHEDAEVIDLANKVRKLCNGLKVHMGSRSCAHNFSSKSHAMLPALTQSSVPTLPQFSNMLPQLSTGVPISGLSSISLNHMPCSPRLLKSQAL